MFTKLCQTLWGDLSREELKKFGLLSIVFFFIIGTYWLMRSLKDAIFLKTVGRTYLPYAKMVSLIFIVLLVLFYGKLVDWFEKHKLVYLLSIAYGLTYFFIAFMAFHPSIGLSNTVTNKYRFFGWFTYCVIESAGTIITALFWSFVASVVDSKIAKKGYPIIVSGAQLGSVIGAFMAMRASWFGIANLIALAGISILIVPIIVKIFVSLHLESPTTTADERKPTGPIEGLKLLFSRRYLMGILVLSTVYEIIGEIINFRMKFLADETYHSATQVAEFMGMFGVATNLLSFIFALIGTSFLIRRFGLTFCLVAYPLTIACVVSYTWAFHSLWVLLTGMMMLKGLSYALNNPCKEIMYIPTSRDMRFKAKSWIDGFGGRTAKGLGASVAAFFPIVSQLALYGSLISFGIIGLWVPIALYVGRTNHALVQENKILE